MSSDLGVHRLAYEPRSETYHVRHDWAADHRLSETVIDAVAAVSSTPRDDLEPFYWTLDASDLDGLYRPDESTIHELETGHVSFTYGDCAVAVFEDGHVIVNRLDSEDD